MYKKGFAIAVIFLFIAISFQSVFAKDAVSLIKKSNKKEVFETIFEIANSNEILCIIQKFENRGSPIRIQHLIGKLQKEILDVIEKNDELIKRIKQISDLPCDCQNDNSTGWHFPFICTLLHYIWFILFLFCVFSAIFLGHYLYNIRNLLFVIVDIASILDCWWYPH